MDMLRGFIVSTAMVVAVFCLGSCGRRDSGSEQVVLYCSVDQAIAEPVIAEFEKQSGIKVLTRFDSEASKTVGLVQKIRAEKDNPNADVFWSSEIFYTIRMGREGLLDPFQCEEFSDWPKTFVDGEKLWHAFGLRARVIAYNTNKITAEKAPKSLEDVLGKRWGGDLLMARPQFGTTGGDVASWFALYGKDEAVEILKDLRDNDIRIVSGNSTAVRMVGNGQADVCFTDTDDVYAAQRNGWPIAMNMLRRNGQGTLAIPNTAALIKGGPNRKNAEALMKFLLSGHAEKMLLKSDSHNWPVDPSKIDIAKEYREYEISEPLKIDYQKVVDNLESALTIAGEILN
jgi:iron(III) transport system substrate-binding protein